MTTAPGDEHAERFTLLRPLLFTIAYEILGSATEADDVLQDSYSHCYSAPVPGLQEVSPRFSRSIPSAAHHRVS